MKTLLHVLISIAIFIIVSLYYFIGCEDLINAIKCTLVIGTLSSFITFIMLHYDYD